jgi:hypothetical protein
MDRTPPSLALDQRGFLAGLARLECEKAALDRALAPDRLREAWHRLCEQPPDQRATASAELLAGALAPLPPGSENLDPSWLLQRLLAEPPGLALALAAGSPLLEEVRLRTPGAEPWSLPEALVLELARAVFAPLESMLGEPAGPLGHSLAALAPGSLLLELARWGARTIGVSLSGTALGLRARAMAGIGAPWSSEVAAAAARPTAPPARERARLQIAAAASLPTPTPLHRLRAVGVMALGPALRAEGSASALTVAGRLPIQLGRALLEAC